MTDRTGALLNAPLGGVAQTGYSGPFWGGVAGGSANALTAATGYGIKSMPSPGTIVMLRTGASNSGAATIVVDSVSATAIQKNGGSLAAGDLPGTTNIILVSDGTNWQLEGGTGSGSSNAYAAVFCF